MERSTELQDRVLNEFEAFSSRDASMVDCDTSRHEGVRLIGTDPDEWFEGEQVAEVFKPLTLSDLPKSQSREPGSNVP
jgi:hypothetical protein